MYVDYHVHPLSHSGGDYTEGLLIPYLSEARERGLTEIGFADHDEYWEGLDRTIIASVSASSPDLKIKLGMEVSYWPGRETEIAGLARRYPFDYLIGSVHDIDNWMFDHPAYRMGYRAWEFDDLYRKYYELIKGMAHSRLFDIVGHLDLIKKYGYRPEGDLLPFAELALQAIRQSGLVVELNTAGLHKPCAAIYPSQELLSRCFELDIPVTLGSDAHTESEVGRDFVYAREILYRIGYRRIAVFSQRQRSFISL